MFNMNCTSLKKAQYRRSQNYLFKKATLCCNGTQGSRSYDYILSYDYIYDSEGKLCYTDDKLPRNPNIMRLPSEGFLPGTAGWEIWEIPKHYMEC